MQKFLLLIFGLANAGSALAFELPSCDDKKVLQKVRFQNGEAVPGPDGAPKDIIGAREVSRGSPPPAVNQYATETTFVTKSRFCEARITFENGSEDVVYWRVDHLTEEGKVTSRVDSCTTRGDPFKDGCEFWRPAK